MQQEPMTRETGDFAEKGRELRQDMGRAAGELRSKAQDIRQDVRELASAATTAAREQLDPVENYIRDNPMRSVLIAMGVGMLLGAIFRGR